jgi:uncharacterized damage-inducible protein DinB
LRGCGSLADAGYNQLMIRLRTVLNSWEVVREDTAQAVSDFPESSMAETLFAGGMSFEETARHILEIGHGDTGALLDGVDNFAIPHIAEIRALYLMPLAVPASKADLSEALVESLRDRVAELGEQPETFWQEEVTRYDNQRVTRMEFVQYMKEHELTHRAQLFVFLRLKGIVPPTTRRREAARHVLQA